MSQHTVVTLTVLCTLVTLLSIRCDLTGFEPAGAALRTYRTNVYLLVRFVLALIKMVTIST